MPPGRALLGGFAIGARVALLWQHNANLVSSTPTTRHRAITSVYSLTFCVRVTLPERHQWKPAVQAAAVMQRTPPSTASHRPASHAHFPYTARNFENASVTSYYYCYILR